MSNKRILIIEDEKPLRDAFAFLLTSEGYEVALAENGKVGVHKLREFKPHLILLDMLMPIMNGLEFLKAVREEALKPELKIVMLSNLSDPITLENAHVYGVDSMVLKAELSPKELAQVVKAMLDT